MRLQCMMLSVVLTGASLPHEVLAQTKSAAAQKSPLCTRINALDMIKQQVELTKTYNDQNRRIAVLIRAADVMWAHQQDKARAVFAEAFDVAVQEEKKVSAKGPHSVVGRMQTPDQRYVVLRAITKRDTAWAKELVGQMLKSDETEAATRKDSFEETLTAERLLNSAKLLLPGNLNAAVDLARVSLKYPASAGLTHFLYRLAETNQPAADEFYAQALTAYGDKPLREFLYLQAYPFAWFESLNTPMYANYTVPDRFSLNQSLQRQFMQALLRRAQQALEAPLDPSDTYRSSDSNLLPATVYLLQGLIRVEPQVRESLPDLLPAVTQAREKLLVSLSPEHQQPLLYPGREISTAPRQTFAERIEAAEKVSDDFERDELITSAVFSGSSEDESVAGVVQAIDKLNDLDLREHLRQWFYFQRAITAIQKKDYSEAERLAAKVAGPEQRAHVCVEIAKRLLNKPDTQTHAREVLDYAIADASRVGTSLFVARILLTATVLYAKIDLNKSIGLLAQAINCINRLDAPDFVSDDQAFQLELPRRGKSGVYRGDYIFRSYMPGLDPERAFRELAQIDFDMALAQSTTINDKFQRGLATISVAEVCLQQTESLPKNNTNKPKL